MSRVNLPADHHLTTTRLQHYGSVLFLIWTLLILASGLHTIYTRKLTTHTIALAEARMAYQKDILYRKWATSHGGVYVPVDTQTEPNPNLSHIPERDLTTPSGRQLTLMNPAFITRQVYEFAKSFPGPNGHLVSDRPLHRQNRPDSWEAAALKQLSNEEQEYYTLNRSNGLTQFRYIRAFVTEKPCLKCHAKHGYREGDIRGGVSVTLPMHELLAIESAEIKTVLTWHSILWLIGAGGLFIGYRRLNTATTLQLQQEQELREQNDELTMLEEELRQQVDEYVAVHDELVLQKAKLCQLNESLEQKVAVRTIALSETNGQLEHEIKQREAANDEISLLNADLQQRALALEQINHELESFSYSVSHDLRAPLRHINSFSTLLIDDCGAELSAKGNDYLQRICNASNRMGLLIDELLRLSRVSRSDLHHLPVNLSAMTSDITAQLTDTDADRRVAFSIAPDLQVTGDPTLLRQMMENLLGNAWKYTSQTLNAEITVGRTYDNGNSVYFIRDNGVGFDMAYANKLFGAFQRLHGAEFEGVGIGLAIVQRIVTRHNGKIWAQSVPGEGATFFFTLPSSS